MSAPPIPPRDPYAAMRYPEFRRLVVATFLITSAMLVQEVVLGYEVYLITRDPLALGFVGLAEAVPFIALALFGGHLADRRERIGLMRASLSVILASSAVLAVLFAPAVRAHLSSAAQLGAIYGSVFLLGLARGIYSPAASSLKAFLVPRELYPNSSAWVSAFWQAGAVLGPVAAGFAYAALTLSGTLAAAVACFVLALWLQAGIARRPVTAPPASESLWTSLREGLAYVYRSKIILYAITLDMASVFFGGVVAILPVFAEDILAVGPQGLGMLRAAPSVGALLTMFVCTFHPPTAHAWRNLLWAVAGFGVATLVFAVSRSFLVSVAMLFLVGAFDSVSVIIRQTLLQALPPDHLRGRVVAVNSIFVTTSNELGAFESGLAARLLGTVPSVLFGGAMTLAIAATLWRRGRELFAVRL
ncbi:MAG TPA: MFS transporter [Candidatus Binatia bacterium]|nr:MFS transporter [Candidatus Binatia bacterium]